MARRQEFDPFGVKAEARARRRKELSKVRVPYVPVVENPTAKQRNVQKDLIIRGLRRQGVDLSSAEERAALPKAARLALAYAQAVQQDQQVRVMEKTGRAHLEARGKRRPSQREALIAGSRVLADRPQAKAGPAPTRAKLQVAGIGPNINVTAALGAIGDFGDRVAGGHGGGVSAPNLAARFAKDAINLPVVAVQAVGEVSKATHEALGRYGLAVPGVGALTVLGGALSGKSPIEIAKGSKGGDFKRAGRLADAGTRGPVGELVVHGDPEAALRSFEENPLYGLLDVSGAYALAGRALGAAGRGAAAAGRAGKMTRLERLGRALGDTRRADLQLFPGSQQVFSRSYSKNALTKALQVRGERALARRGLDPNVVRHHGTLREGDIVGPIRERLSGQTKQMRGAIDEFVSTQQAVQRAGRSETIEAVQDATRGAGPVARVKAKVHPLDEIAAQRGQRLKPAERDVLAAVIERQVVARGDDGKIVSHVRADTTPEQFRAGLVAERNRLEREWADGGRERMIAEHGQEMAHLNRAQVRALDRVIKSPKALRKVQSIALASERIIKESLDPTEKGLIASKVLDPDQATAAKIRTYAVANMDARPQPGLKGVQQTERFEAARSAETAAKAELDAIDKKLSAARSARDRHVGKAQSQRGRDRASQGETMTATKARVTREADRAGEIERLDGQIKRWRAEKRVAKAKYRQARRERVKSNPRRSYTGLVDRDGNRVTTHDILEHMQAHNVEVGGFLSHSRLRASSSFNRGTLSRPVRKASLSPGARTGAAARGGMVDPTFDHVVESAVRRRGDLDNIESADRFMGQFGVTNPDTGRPFTPSEAERFAAKQGWEVAPGGLEGAVPGRPTMVPVNLGSSRLSQKLLDQIAGDQGVLPLELTDSLGKKISVGEARVREAIEAGEKAWVKKDPKANIVLLPAEQLERFVKHQQVATSTAGKVGNVLTSAFRGTVLPFSTKWLTGNVAEAFLRMAVAGVRPSDFIRGGRIIRELEKLDGEAWKLLEARGFGGLLYGSHEQLRVRRSADQFQGTSLSGVATRVEQARHVPVFSQVVSGIQGVQRGVFQANKWFEQSAQRAVLGKYGRERMQEFSGSWIRALRMQEKAAKQVADGLLGTPEQVRFARYVDETLGKYSRFSPTMRRLTQQAMPFLPWYLNSVRFVFHTLPAKHPVKLAMLANMEKELKGDFEKRLSDAGGVPPGDLRASIPDGKGGFLTLARYTPFGAFTGGIESVVDPVLPQLSTAYGIIRYGKSWTGRDLDVGQDYGQKVSEGKKATLAMYSLLESFVPAVSIIRRLQEGGETAYDDSTVFAPHTKPGTSQGKPSFTQALNRVFNPVRPTVLKPGGSGLTVRKAQPSASSSDPLERALEGIEVDVSQGAPEDDALERALAGVR